MADTSMQREQATSREVSGLDQAMNQFLQSGHSLSADQLAQGRERAQRFLQAIERLEVEQFRASQPEIHDLRTLSFCSEPNATALRELNFKDSTKAFLSTLVVEHFSDPAQSSLLTKVAFGLDSIQDLILVSKKDLTEAGASKPIIRDIESVLKSQNLSLASHPASRDSARVEIYSKQEFQDLHGGFQGLDKVRDWNFAEQLEASRILYRDLAIIPGISAELVGAIRRIPIYEDETGVERHPSTVSDFVQLFVDQVGELPGFDVAVVTNYLLQFGLCCGMSWPKNCKAAQRMGIVIIDPIEQSPTDPLPLSRYL